MTLFCPNGTHYQVFSPLRTDQKHPSENPYDTLVFIHGVGLGVLKEEVRSFFRNFEGLEVYDADFREYGKGATVVEVSYSSQ